MFRIIFLALLISNFSYAQNFYVVGGTVHVGNGEVIENAAIIIEDGKISEIADARLIKIDNSFGEVINATGKHIYPGLIAPNTRIGLVEIDALKPSKDFIEIGEFTPNVRSLIAYNTDSDIEATILSNGITYAQIVPQGGIISGSSSVVKLDAWNWEDAAVKADDGIHIYWPSRYSRSGWWANPGKLSENENYQSKIDDLEIFLKAAKAYSEVISKEINLKFEALKGIFADQQNLYVHTNGAKEMIHAIGMIKSLDIKTMVIVGGGEAMEISDLIKENNIPIIVRSIHELPSKNQSDVDELYKLPAQLQKEGIQYCLSYKNAWQQRNLMFLAGTAAAYGLTKEEALAAITKNSAEILRLENLGSLEKGKQATLLISTGDILDMRTSNVERAFINGKEIDLGNKQKDLYNKYISKYKSEGKL